MEGGQGAKRPPAWSRISSRLCGDFVPLLCVLGREPCTWEAGPLPLNSISSPVCFLIEPVADIFNLGKKIQNTIQNKEVGHTFPVPFEKVKSNPLGLSPQSPAWRQLAGVDSQQLPPDDGT
jgi:hypothetical protein